MGEQEVCANEWCPRRRVRGKYCAVHFRDSDIDIAAVVARLDRKPGESLQARAYRMANALRRHRSNNALAQRYQDYGDSLSAGSWN